MVGETTESAASLDVMNLRKIVSPHRHEQGLRRLESVVAMLIKMLGPSKR